MLNYDKARNLFPGFFNVFLYKESTNLNKQFSKLYNYWFSPILCLNTTN